MAGDWIKLRKTLFADPRIVRMMSALKADKFRTVGGLLSAWCLADDQTEDGTLTGYSPEVLDDMVGFPGLARAMEKVGWLIVEDETLIFPRFSEHNGKTAKRRAQDCVRKMSARNADKKRTREEKRREEKNISLTHTEAEGFEEDWKRWTEYLFAKTGDDNQIQLEAMLYKLCQSGPEKAKADIEFSILKGAKSILDSSNDFANRQSGGGGRKPKMEII